MTVPAVSRLDRERIATLTLRAVFDPLAMLHNTEARSRRDHAHLALTNLLGTLPRDEWPTTIAIYQNGTVGFLDPAADGGDAAEHLTPGLTTTITELVLEEPQLDADTVALNLEADQLYATYDDVVGAWPEHADVWRAVALKARQLHRPTGPSMGELLADITEDELPDALLAAARESEEPSLDPTVPHGFDMNPAPAERGICDRCRCGKEVRDPIHSGPRAFDDVMAFPEEDPGADLDEPKDPDSDLAERVANLERGLHGHITVPSWWNKRTDTRLAKLEETVNTLILDGTRVHGPDDEPNLVEQLLWQHTPPPEPKLDAAQAARIEQLEARVAQLTEALEAAQLRSIEARNPGIDMDKVKATRAAQAAPSTNDDILARYDFWRPTGGNVITVTVTQAVHPDHVDERVARYMDERAQRGDRVESWDYNETTRTLSFRVRLAPANDQPSPEPEPERLLPYPLVVDPKQVDEIARLLPTTDRGWFLIPGPLDVPGAVADIATERRAQIDRWGLDHDDEHKSGELLLAALCYLGDARRTERIEPVDLGVPPWWPFESESWHPSHDAVRELVKAGALIAAEIDRLRRAQA